MKEETTTVIIITNDDPHSSLHHPSTAEATITPPPPTTTETTTTKVVHNEKTLTCHCRREKSHHENFLTIIGRRKTLSRVVETFFSIHHSLLSLFISLLFVLWLWLLMLSSHSVVVVLAHETILSNGSEVSTNNEYMSKTLSTNFSCQVFSNITIPFQHVNNETMTTWKLEFNQTLSDLNCMNGGFCESYGDGNCNCTFTNYTGQNCSIPRRRSEDDNSDQFMICKEGENCIYGHCIDQVDTKKKTCQCDTNAYTLMNDTTNEQKSIMYCNAKYCPNNCTDAFHGICNVTTGICHCLDNYFGPNCSWIECRNPSCIPGRGKCDYSTGQCICIAPYFGEGCAQTQCPDPSCRGVGRCNHEIGVCECDAGMLSNDDGLLVIVQIMNTLGY